jgi:hypothetical protein
MQEAGVSLSSASSSAENALDLDNQPVVSTELGHRTLLGQHLGPQMGQDDPLGFELVPVLHDGRIVQMKWDGLAVEVALGDEQVGVLRQDGHEARPLAVARIGHDLAARTDPDRRRFRFRRMNRWISHDLQWAHFVLTFGFKLDEIRLEPGRHALHSRKERMLHFEHTLLNADRAPHHQRPLPFRAEHGVQHEERNPSAVVAMNVSADNRVDRVVVDAERLERNEAGGAEVNRKAYAGNVNENAGVETASGSERISASDEGNLC